MTRVVFPRCNGMPPRTSDEKGVRLSVRRLSVCQTRALWQNGR